MSSIFGPEFAQIWPKNEASLKLTDFGKKLLMKCKTLEKPDPSKVNINDFVKKSSNFPLEFGTNTCRVISQPKSRYPIIEKQIASAYPVIHERVLGLYLAFLEHKCKFGTEQELKIYPDLSLTDLVTRLLTKRCASFLDAKDYYLLLDGTRGNGGFEEVGTPNEKEPLLLKNVLSYDEIKLSSLLSVSSHTEFLNDGNRFNAGRIENDKSKIETEGVVVGIVGGRFERPNCMEWQDIMITQEQNTNENGYGSKAELTRATDYRRVWNEFYETKDLLYDEAKNIESARFHKFQHIFDNVVMKKRYAISFDTLLLDGEARAAAVGKQAYIHVVGIGLGVWKAVEHQTKIFLETFAQRLKALLPKLNHVGVVHFSWFHMTEWNDLKDGGIYRSEVHPNGGIKTFLSNRNPADKLPSEFQNMLPVVSYAWDGNALPGNEFWVKNLTATGDTSTACSTLISELQNPFINTQMVNGENLRIATLNGGVLHLRDYCENALKLF